MADSKIGVAELDRRTGDAVMSTDQPRRLLAAAPSPLRRLIALAVALPAGGRADRRPRPRHRRRR